MRLSAVSAQASGHSGLAYGQSEANQTRRASITLRMTLIKGTPAKYLGHVHAKDEAEAIKEAAKEFKVAEALQDRIVATRDELG